MSETHIDYFRDPLTGDIIQDADFRPLTVKRSHPPGNVEPPSMARLLERIATALEEQNRFNWQWLETSTAWHEDSAENGRRITAIHEENAKRDQSHRAQMESMAENQACLVREMLQESYEAYVESLKSPSKELVKAVGEALANDMRRSTGRRENDRVDHQG